MRNRGDLSGIEVARRSVTKVFADVRAAHHGLACEARAGYGLTAQQVVDAVPRLVDRDVAPLPDACALAPDAGGC